MPTQPVPFQHTIHVQQLGMDCRYCHSYVEVSEHSNVPTTQTCMNCHTAIKSQSPKLQPVRDSWASGQARSSGCASTACPTTRISTTPRTSTAACRA